MAPELGSVVPLPAWLQAVSLSNDGKQTLYHFAIKTEAGATLGTVVMTREQYESLQGGA